MGRGGASAREISFVSLMAYCPKVSDSALALGVTASETWQGSSQQRGKSRRRVIILEDIAVVQARNGGLGPG